MGLNHRYVTRFGETRHKAANKNLTFWYQIEEHFLENTCSFPLQSYGHYKSHFCIHVNVDVNFDKLVHEI